MNHSTLVIPNSAGLTYVASRLTSNNSVIRPGKLIEVEAFNGSGATAYLMYFNKLTAAPVNGTTGDEGFAVAAGAGGTLGTPRDIDGGIWVWSTTPQTLTAAGAIGSIIVIMKGGS